MHTLVARDGEAMATSVSNTTILFVCSACNVAPLMGSTILFAAVKYGNAIKIAWHRNVFSSPTRDK